MKSICLCASKKYHQEVAQLAKVLRRYNLIVFEPNFKEPIQENTHIHSANITQTIFKGLTLEHFDWIRKADICYVYNLEDYVGVSVTMEMAYASALGKTIIAYSAQTGDPCRNALIDLVIASPEKLIKILK